MQTLLLPATSEAIAQAVAILRAGGLVAFPTETVYGLGASAHDDKAVRAIFEAKGRPADNPLIVHVTSADEACRLWRYTPPEAHVLMRRFWPGPLTLVLPAAEGMPDAVTAGMPTVAVRCPSHGVARALIEGAGPIAAPSANASGRPSPTRAQHVLDDLAGRIPLILDDGPCAGGLESTVLSLADGPELLRPGGITREQLEEALGRDVPLAKGVEAPLASDDAARSPGMKHRHYAPNARVTVIAGHRAAFVRAACARYDEAPGTLILCYEASLPSLGARACLSLGADGVQAASALYAGLREADARGFARVLVEGGEGEAMRRGIGLAVANRLLRAADFDVVNAREEDA